MIRRPTARPNPVPAGGPRPGRAVDRDLRRALVVTALVLWAMSIVAPMVLASGEGLSDYFLAEDGFTLSVTAPVMALIGLSDLPRLGGCWTVLSHRPMRSAALMAGGVVLVAVALTGVLHRGFPLSYDEVMAAFDSAILRGGRLIAPVPPEWRAFVPALAPHFLLPVPGHLAWASSYLPVNAMLRAGFGLLGVPALTGPVLAGAAVLAAARVARRVWPDRPDAAVVAGLLLATAPQVLVTATTAYAMTGHLALNLLWLLSFLRGGRRGHAGAALVGFLACGLHQLAFHPLFALPFLWGLVLRRRWGPAAFHGVAYALTGLVWTSYGGWTLAAAGIDAAGAAAPGSGDLLGTAALLLGAPGPARLALMAENLLRFVAWENPLLLPLGALAWPALRRGEGLTRPLAVGVLLTLAAMAALMPYQGHGWGYRYLHGLIGGACLLGAQGWVTATQGLAPAARALAGRVVGAGTLMAVLLPLPLQVLQAHRFAAPSAAAVAAIAALDADVALVDDRGIPFGSDLVRNAPDLSNRPRVLLLRRLDAAQVQALCGRGTVALFGPADAARAGFATVPAPDDPGSAALAEILTTPACRRPPG